LLLHLGVGISVSSGPSNSILIAHAADLSVREIYLDHIFRCTIRRCTIRARLIPRKKPAQSISGSRSRISIRDHALPRGWQLLAPVACLAGVVAVLSPILVPMVRAAIGSASVPMGGGDVNVADVFAYTAFPRFHLLGPLADGVYRRQSGNGKGPSTSASSILQCWRACALPPAVIRSMC
jgi:hypothetical protein